MGTSGKQCNNLQKICDFLHSCVIIQLFVKKYKDYNQSKGTYHQQ